MKALVLGSGAREHALTWKFSKSKRISGLFIAPGNAGTAELGENLPDLDPMDLEGVVRICGEKRIDFVFVGPEDPLAAGIVDRLNEAGIRVFGPHRRAAQLEASKSFSKQFMRRHSIPTAEFREFENEKGFAEYVSGRENRVVVKKCGLAAGKGVMEAENRDELIRFGRQILAHDSLVVEDYLVGDELSVFALTDGKDRVLLPVCSDFKKSEEDDKGKNTGGMGAVCPVPIVDSVLTERITTEIIDPTFRGLKEEDLTFKGVLYFGIMNTDAGPRLLEYNVRFGDPEAQVLLPLIESDFANLMDAIIDEKLIDFPLRISDKSSLGVVIASGGYPDHYKKGLAIAPIPPFPEEEVLVFHATTKTGRSGQILTGGGRCFTVVGLGNNLLNANFQAYEAAKKISFEGSWYRRDIGKKFFID
ncbi:MAG TPA: phosphoribosylamine--glycine ligase [Spirochaetia bacterium]|nr:phosphoribosylamine--glycine ligase [Spirochaetia bacterium]